MVTVVAWCMTRRMMSLYPRDCRTCWRTLSRCEADLKDAQTNGNRADLIYIVVVACVVACVMNAVSRIRIVAEMHETMGNVTDNVVREVTGRINADTRTALEHVVTTEELQATTSNITTEIRAEIRASTCHDQEFSCPVCLETTCTMAASTACGHVLCMACAQRVAQTCPMCRQFGQYIRIYVGRSNT